MNQIPDLSKDIQYMHLQLQLIATTEALMQCQRKEIMTELSKLEAAQNEFSKKEADAKEKLAHLQLNHEGQLNSVVPYNNISSAK